MVKLLTGAIIVFDKGHEQQVKTLVGKNWSIHEDKPWSKNCLTKKK